MNERKLTKSELAKREDIIMKMKKNKRSLVQKYGKDAEKVMYGRATKLAKKQAEAMDQDRIKELVKDALQNPKKADLNKDGKLSDYEKKRGAAIEKSMEKQDLKEFGSSDMSAVMNSIHRSLGEPKDFPGIDKITDAAYDAVNFYMDDFDGFVNDEDDLAMNAARMYADRYHSDFMDNARKFMEPISEDLDLGHQDNEPHMLKSDLYRIGKYAMELYQMVDEFEYQGEVDFPHWWQSKVVKAKDMMVSAKHYLDFEVNEPQIDAMTDVASGEDVIDEPLNEGVWSLGTVEQIKSAIQSLEMLRGMDAASIADSLEDDHKFYYNVLGDDNFQDELDNASRRAAMGQEDGATISLLNAIDRAEDLLKMQMEKEGKLTEEAPGEADTVASDIQKAMNASKGDEAKTHQLKKARVAMNKGDLEKAKKIADRIAKQLKSK